MTINFTSTDDFIETADKEATYSYDVIVELLKMKQKESEHISETDVSKLVGKADYSNLNDDEVRAIISWNVDTITTKLNAEHEMELKIKESEKQDAIEQHSTNVKDAYMEEILQVVNNIQYRTVIDDGTTQE